MELPEEAIAGSSATSARTTKKRILIAMDCSASMPLYSAIQEDTDDGTVKIITPALRSALYQMDLATDSCIWVENGKESKKRAKLVDEPPILYMLKFAEPLSTPVYTTRKLTAVSKAGLQIKLIDIGSGKICTEPLFSSLQVEIFLVNGDFHLDNSARKSDELYGNKLSARKGKRPLLLGTCVRSLKEGRTTFNDLFITDNSSWVSPRTFKLVACITPGPCKGMRIMEAFSEPFSVKECRVAGHEKHIKSLEDPVWRLNNIRKKGVYQEKLDALKIYTVGDFLKESDSSGEELKRVLGMQETKWQQTVEQARKFRSGQETNMSNLTEDMFNGAVPNADSLHLPDFQAQNMVMGQQGYPEAHVGSYQSFSGNSSSRLAMDNVTNMLQEEDDVLGVDGFLSSEDPYGLGWGFTDNYIFV